MNDPKFVEYLRDLANKLERGEVEALHIEIEYGAREIPNSDTGCMEWDPDGTFTVAATFRKVIKC